VQNNENYVQNNMKRKKEKREGEGEKPNKRKLNSMD